MSKEIARFQLTSGVNNLERWVIPDNVNVITENTDSTHYTESYQHKFYNSAIINFDTSLYGYLWASSMLLFDASCQITVERSTNGGSTWSSYRTTNCQTLRGSFYTLSGGDSGIGGTYWINMNSNDAQCISSVLPICNNATDFNNAVTNVYVPEITSGGAGSGYIGNALVSNKKMVGYNVPTSSAESTKTESVEDASESPVSGKPKIGNGFARIKLVREIPKYSFRDLAKTLDIDHKQVTTQWADISPLSQYYNTDYILVTQQYNGNYFTSFDGIDGIGRDTVSYTGCRMYVPIKPIRAVSAKASVKIEPSSRTSQYSLLHLYLGHLENNEWTLNHIGGIQINGTESEWTEISKIFDSPINAEYIVVYSMDNQWHFKNVEITGDLL